MKLNKNFLVHNTGKEVVVVPTSEAAFSGVVKGNRTLGVILELLEKETTEEKMIDAMCSRFDASRETIAEDVRSTIDRLKKIGAIDD